VYTTLRVGVYRISSLDGLSVLVYHRLISLSARSF